MEPLFGSLQMALMAPAKFKVGKFKKQFDQSSPKEFNEFLMNNADKPSHDLTRAVNLFNNTTDPFHDAKDELKEFISEKGIVIPTTDGSKIQDGGRRRRRKSRRRRRKSMKKSRKNRKSRKSRGRKRKSRRRTRRRR